MFRSVALGIWVKTGSRNETLESNGISHMIEHMLFKGTERFSAKDIADRFDGIGGHVNAFTAKEYTCYYAKVLDQHTETAIDLLSDMFFRSLFAVEELEKERNVILEEISMYEDTPDDAVHDLIFQAGFGNHSLGYPIIGSRENVQRFQSEDLKKYMNKWYRADDLVISIAGKIDNKLLDLIEDYFGKVPLSGTPDVIKQAEISPNHLVIDKKTEQHHFCFSLPGIKHNDPQMFSMAVLTNLLGGGMSSRLFQEVREKRGLAYSVYSYHSAMIDSGMFTVYAGTAPKQSDQVAKIIMDTLKDVVINGVNETEVHRCREQMKGSFILGLESSHSRMNRIAKNELLGLQHLQVDDVLAKIDAVSVQTVNDLVQSKFRAPLSSAWVGHFSKRKEDWKRGNWYE